MSNSCKNLTAKELSYLFFSTFVIGIQEAGPEGGKIQLHFEDLLKSNTGAFVVSDQFWGVVKPCYIIVKV